MDNIVYSTEINQYALYEKAEQSLYTRRCIDGTIVGCSKCYGYCKYKEHPGFLTKKLRKQHNCIEKECFHYVGKPKKEKLSFQETHDQSSLIFSIVKQISEENESVKVLRVESNIEFNYYTVFFVTITNDYSFDVYKEEIHRTIGANVDFKRLNYDFDKCVALIRTS